MTAPVDVLKLEKMGTDGLGLYMENISLDFLLFINSLDMYGDFEKHLEGRGRKLALRFPFRRGSLCPWHRLDICKEIKLSSINPGSPTGHS